MDKNLKSLKQKEARKMLEHVTFTSENKQAVLNKIHSYKKRGRAIPQVILTIFSLFVAGGLYFFIQESQQNLESITDSVTSPEVVYVSSTDSTFTVEWLSDAMDRGNHDYSTFHHSLLVVDSNIPQLTRGKVVYYEMPKEVRDVNPDIPERYIGRVVALPGETVKIMNGQVWINGKKLDTFYGEATMHGLNEESYFEKISSENVENEESIRSSFNIDMKEIKIKENELFILVDQWWRGTDSRTYGPLSQDAILGIVLGYEE